MYRKKKGMRSHSPRLTSPNCENSLFKPFSDVDCGSPATISEIEFIEDFLINEINCVNKNRLKKSKHMHLETRLKRDKHMSLNHNFSLTSIQKYLKSLMNTGIMN